ncbi:MAG: hypothetical protein ACFFB5_10105 [Promethearchaeota archaeon]
MSTNASRDRMGNDVAHQGIDQAVFLEAKIHIGAINSCTDITKRGAVKTADTREPIKNSGL